MISGTRSPAALESASGGVVGWEQDKMENLRVAEDAVREAVGGGAQVVILPEIFNGCVLTFPRVSHVT